ncbi:MAG: hypothetical protein COB50_01945 [Thiotrichales bacterium]|nr:MAG: hypothetical protein COB50_01945 [Thiotrichales bacterium]
MQKITVYSTKILPLIFLAGTLSACNMKHNKGNSIFRNREYEYLKQESLYTPSLKMPAGVSRQVGKPRLTIDDK